MSDRLVVNVFNVDAALTVGAGEDSLPRKESTLSC